MGWKNNDYDDNKKMKKKEWSERTGPTKIESEKIYKWIKKIGMTVKKGKGYGRIDAK